MPRRLGVGLALLVGALTGAFALFWRFSHRAYEKPSYRVVDRRKGWEIREYESTIEAHVTVRGPFDHAVEQGFRILAAYIFGANSDEAAIAMTSPVAARALPASGSGRPEGWTVSFTMPSRYALEDLPTPLDQRIELVTMPGAKVAARRFSGKARHRRFDRESGRLRKALEHAGMADAELGALVVAQYDPPTIPSFLRRNEILIPLVA